jgi:hypothetical protein
MWHHVLVRYLIFTVLAHLLWEAAQLPLYGIWADGSRAWQAFAVIHCTGGDVFIALASLALALILVGRGGWPEEDRVRVIVAASVIGAGYTIYSEWLNTTVWESWSYAPSMPRLPVLGTGLSPLAQWIILPPLGLWWSHRAVSASAREST